MPHSSQAPAPCDGPWSETYRSGVTVYSLFLKGCNIRGTTRPFPTRGGVGRVCEESVGLPVLELGKWVGRGSVPAFEFGKGFVGL